MSTNVEAGSWVVVNVCPCPKQWSISRVYASPWIGSGNSPKIEQKFLSNSVTKLRKAKVSHRIPLKNIISRSCHRRCSVKKGVVRNFAKFTGKHLYERLYFNKVAGLRLVDTYREKLQEQFNIQEQLNRILAASDWCLLNQ